MKNSLKVLHFSTSQFGGAGVAAVRTNDALSEYGLNSKIISRDGKSKYNFNKLENFSSSVFTFLQNKIIQNSPNLMTPYSLGFFKKFYEVARVADVIHLHASYNLVNSDLLEYVQGNNKLLVCTLHDERFYTGGCHVSKDCNNFISGCSKCPQASMLGKVLVRNSFKQNLSSKKKLKNIVIIAPSLWIENRFKQSKFGSQMDSYCVPNPIPSCFNSPKNNTSLNIKDKKKVVTFISFDLNNPIKNLELIKRAFDCMSQSELEKILLNLVGGGSVTGFPKALKVIKHGNLSTFQTAEVLKATDVVLVPSLYDNFPNTVSEALVAGCYVIGSTIGGIPESLLKFEMPVIDPFSPESLAGEITKAPYRTDINVSIKALEIFSYKSIAKQIATIYDKHLN